MKNKNETIKKIVRFLNNPDEEGGFWLPNIQRPFVWNDEQICRLFDSILREYPISTLLVWKTTSNIRRRKFIDNWKESLRLSDFYVPPNTKKKTLVLDGQQRLQSLFIGLNGSYEGKELYFDILSGEVDPPDDVKYRFSFVDPATAHFPQVKFKDLIFTPKKTLDMMASIESYSGRSLTQPELTKVQEHLILVDRTFKMDEAVTYQELDTIDNPSLYTEDDVVEVFIRANSGGTKLAKSDLLFSLLTVSWEVADEKMDVLLESLNTHGFEFDRDFVLKTCLVLLGQGAVYEVAKFRKEGVREDIEAKWNGIAEAIQEVLDFVRGRTFIRCDKALLTYLVLIPLVYVRYKFPAAWKDAKNVDTYLLRCSLAGAFSGHSDQLLDALIKKLEDLKAFSVEEAFAVIRSQLRSLELTEDRFWQMGYGSNTIHVLFNLWYRKFNYTPAYTNNFPQIDHIFPQSVLRKEKKLNPDTGKKDMMKYPKRVQDQLANCMLLTQKENGSGGKGDTLPEVWFAKNNDQTYLDMHLIPADRSLWKLDRFEDFIEERKKLIRERFKDLLVQSEFPLKDTLMLRWTAQDLETQSADHISKDIE